MKYIIELEDEPMIANSFNQEVGELWKAKGFNSLVFDKYGLYKLTPYTELDRKAIEDETWGLAERIADMSYDDFISCFEGETEEYVYGLPYHEIKAKYDAWKKSKEEIRVGCEVHHRNIPELIIYVTDMDDNSFGGFALCRVKDVCDYGDRFSECNVHQYKPTGRVFPNIAELLKKMEEE